MAELLEAPDSAAGSAPDLAPVYDADAESNRDKNLRIAKELFKDDGDDAPALPQPTLNPTPAASNRPAKAPVEDARGRLHRADGTVMSRAEAEAVRSQQEPSAQPQAEAAPEVAQEPEVENVPLEFLVYGQPFTMDGALYRPGHGAFIPEAKMLEFRQLAARAHKYPSVVEANAKLREQVGQGYTRKEAEADAVLQTIGQHFQTPDAIVAFAQQVLQYPEIVTERLRLAIERKQMELERTVTPLSPYAEESSEPDEGEVSEAFTDELEGFFRDPQYGLVGRFTPAEQAQLRQLTFTNAARFLTKVDRDLDAQGNPIVNKDQQVVIRKGEVLVNRAALLAELQYVAKYKNQNAPRPTVAAPSAPPAPSRPAPPSAVGRSRAQVPAASPPQNTRRSKDAMPNHSVSAVAKYLFDD